MSSGPRQGQTQAVGIGGTAYAKRTGELIRLISEIQAIGAQAELDLPRIAVIGNQSAGKSSLVEAISGITVPRASGTCTRCPMECRLSNSDGPWRCQVSLRFEKDVNGQRLSEVREKPFGPPVTEKPLLEEVLRRAQLAILNPTVPYTSFVDLDTTQVVNGVPPIGSERPLQFSTNVVVAELWGPDLADLAFIDLPGIISNVAEGEDRNNITLVQELVKEHIQGNALILLTLTMRDDLENQSAAFLAKKADPEGSRTIGVLTKADTVFPGEESGWLDVLIGKRHALRKGYYITKQPGPEELKQKPTYEEARSQERTFFATKEPWKSSSRELQSRMGIPNLTSELSTLLSNLITGTLPKLRADARNALNETINALGALPPPLPDNPVIELLRVLNDFSVAALKWIEGAEGQKGLVHTFHEASEKFGKDILRTSPNFRPFENKNEEDGFQDGFTNSEEEILGVDPVSRPIHLPEVRQHIKDSMGRELPFNVPYLATRTMIENVTQTWTEHSLVFFESIYKAMNECLGKEIERVFGRFTVSPLKDHAQSIVDKQLDHFRKQTIERIQWFIELERPPFTQNTRDLLCARDQYLAQYRACRRRPVRNTVRLSAQAALKELAHLGYENLAADDLNRLEKPNVKDREYTVMAEVRAYWDIASKRIIDDIPRVVDHDFLWAIGNSLSDTLTNQFGIGSENALTRARNYLAEDPTVVMRRKDLKGKEQRLEEVLRKLFIIAI